MYVHKLEDQLQKEKLQIGRTSAFVRSTGTGTYPGISYQQHYDTLEKFLSRKGGVLNIIAFRLC
jgi:hypothetical protein